jgi:bifunctional DNA-binding transcriptional regulator/antitoxin component of YhaV-PrlF toxin-antitoxin module
VTFPKAPCEEAGIAAGDRLRVQVDGPGRIVFEKIDAPVGSEEPPV